MEFYKAKYLKYKAKYLELTNNSKQVGGTCNGTDIYMEAYADTSKTRYQALLHHYLDNIKLTYALEAGGTNDVNINHEAMKTYIGCAYNNLEKNIDINFINFIKTPNRIIVLIDGANIVKNQFFLMAMITFFNTSVNSNKNLIVDSITTLLTHIHTNKLDYSLVNNFICNILPIYLSNFYLSQKYSFIIVKPSTYTEPVFYTNNICIFPAECYANTNTGQIQCYIRFKKAEADDHLLIMLYLFIQTNEEMRNKVGIFSGDNYDWYCGVLPRYKVNINFRRSVDLKGTINFKIISVARIQPDNIIEIMIDEDPIDLRAGSDIAYFLREINMVNLQILTKDELNELAKIDTPYKKNFIINTLSKRIINRVN